MKMNIIRSNIIILVTILIFSVSKTAYGHGNQKIQIKPTNIGFSEFSEKYQAVGQVKSTNSRTYNTKVSGRIDSVAIEQGKIVKAGSILLTIDKNLAEAILSHANAALSFAESSYNRDLSLIKKKIISAELVSKSKSDYQQANENFAKALNTYNDMIITAPFDGYIGVVKANIGDEVKAGDYLFSLIEEESSKTMFVELPELLMNKIDLNCEVMAQDINKNPIYGKVLAVSNYLSDKGTISVKLEFLSAAKLIHGSYISVELIYNKHQGVAAPEKAVLKNDKGNFVYKVTQDNQVQQIYFTPGIRSDNMLEIISNELKEGDIIVLEGLTKVSDGALVEFIKSEG